MSTAARTLQGETSGRTWLANCLERSGSRGAVLLHAPSHVFQAPGGGENQLVQTGRYLEQSGVVVHPFNPWVDDLREARVLHLFGMSREGLELARVARARGVPVVLSPICWFEPRAIRALADSPLQAASTLGRWVVQNALPRWPGWRRDLLWLADAILPNSVAEARQLVRMFDVDPDAIHVVHNGVEPRFATATPGAWQDRFGVEPFVLFVGRVEPRKNVLGLILAAREAGLPLTVIGNAPPGREAYFRACREAGEAHVRWIPGLAHHDPLLASAYAAARVVALPSWFETPGLAALEGALAGAAVVVTPYGCTREYFGDRVEYARPERPREVVRALARAWHAGPDPQLASHVGARFLWSEVARRTAEAYDHVAS